MLYFPCMGLATLPGIQSKWKLDNTEQTYNMIQTTTCSSTDWHAATYGIKPCSTCIYLLKIKY